MILQYQYCLSLCLGTCIHCVEDDALHLLYLIDIFITPRTIMLYHLWGFHIIDMDSYCYLFWFTFESFVFHILGSERVLLTALLHYHIILFQQITCIIFHEF